MKGVSLALASSHFRPGGLLEGIASWRLAAAPESAEVRLFWFTTGKGIRDAAVIERVVFETLSEEESRPFVFKLPESPYSFGGRLISLTWAVELVVPPTRETAVAEFILAPESTPIRLESAG